MSTENLLGVVLCGGLSSRMGRDKGLITENGVLWMVRAAETLSRFCREVAYSIHPRQREAYAQMVLPGLLVEDLPEFEDSGPLGGLLSVHKKNPDRDILLLACDMTSVTADDLQPLLEAAGGIVAYRQGEIFEPLCARYTAKSLALILKSYRSGVRDSLQEILQKADAEALAPPSPVRLASRNHGDA